MMGGFLERLRPAMRRTRSLPERQEGGDYVPPRHLLRRIHKEREAFLASWPWRWIPRHRVPARAFLLFGASEGLLRAVEADRRRWRAAQDGERPYWSPDARLRPREDDPEAVRRLLGRLDAREPE